MPFQRKLTPAALPTLATISREARKDVCAGAMRVSWLTAWPSAVMEIQEFSEARMTRVKGAGASAAGCGVVDCGGVGCDAWVGELFPGTLAGAFAGAVCA